MEEKQFNEVVDRMDKIIRLLALQSVAGTKGPELIARLSAAGFGPKEIAELVGSTPGSVNVTLVRLRKGKRKNNAKEN